MIIIEEHERQDIVFHLRCINIDRVDLNITDGCYPLTRCKWISRSHSLRTWLECKPCKKYQYGEGRVALVGGIKQTEKIMTSANDFSPEIKKQHG